MKRYSQYDGSLLNPYGSTDRHSGDTISFVTTEEKQLQYQLYQASKLSGSGLTGEQLLQQLASDQAELEQIKQGQGYDAYLAELQRKAAEAQAAQQATLQQLEEQKRINAMLEDAKNAASGEQSAEQAALDAEIAAIQKALEEAANGTSTAGPGTATASAGSGHPSFQEIKESIDAKYIFMVLGGLVATYLITKFLGI